MHDTGHILQRLFVTIEGRRGADPEASYVASLFAGGLPRVLGKVEEEAAEVLEAAQENDRRHLIHESADLLFHLMVLWASTGITPQDVLGELQRREGTSGHTEKAGRTTSS